jgi:AAA+ ATPase superfamily predicted ATPase
MKPNNPFLISGYFSPEFFCDRRSETEAIMSALNNGRNITLMAPRRMGKTGLIRHAFYNINQQERDTVTLYMDIYSTQSLSDFVRLFAATVLGQPCSAAANQEATLKEIFDYLGSADRRCYIAIDEFQQIAEYPEKGVEALLRSYIQFLPNTNFIFSGSKQHVMQQMFASSKRPFYQSTQMLTIGNIDRSEYARFAKERFANNNLQLSDDVFNTIYDKFEGHTWYMQCILNRLYSFNRDVDSALVDLAVNQIITENAYAYADLLKAYTPGQIKLLKAIAAEGRVAEILSGEFISKYDLRAASSVSSALKKLVGNELVYKSDDGYMVYDRFMNEWMCNQVF